MTQPLLVLRPDDPEFVARYRLAMRVASGLLTAIDPPPDKLPTDPEFLRMVESHRAFLARPEAERRALIIQLARHTLEAAGYDPDNFDLAEVMADEQPAIPRKRTLQ